MYPRYPRNPRLLLSFVFYVAVAASGCGSSDMVRVTGQLVKDGKPYTAKLEGNEPETFAVDFVGTVNGSRYLFPANITAGGEFRVDGTEGQGIPRGKYRITVLHSGFLGAGGDRLQTRFASEKTPLVVDVTDNAHYTIDLGTGTVSK
jgi:hypothetical protein